MNREKELLREFISLHNKQVELLDKYKKDGSVVVQNMVWDLECTINDSMDSLTDILEEKDIPYVTLSYRTIAVREWK